MLPCMFYLAGFFRFNEVSRIRSDISLKEGFMIIKVLKARVSSSVKAKKSLSYNCLVLYVPLSCLRGV